MDCFVVIDCGTSGCRAAVVAHNGRILDTIRKPVQIDCPEPFFAEVDTGRIWQQVCAALTGLLDHFRPHQVAAVGVSAMLGYVLLDRNARPLMPAAIWMDNRARVQTERIRESIQQDEIYRKTGRRPTPELLAPRLLWLAEHRPDIYRQINRVIGLKDDIVRRLTGTITTDVAHLDYTLLHNIVEQRLDEGILGALQIDPSIFSPAQRAGDLAGTISLAAARTTGLAAGTPVVVGSSDGTTAMYGGGALEENTAVMVAGTTDVLMASASNTVDDPQQVLSTNTAMVPGRYLAGGAMGMAGGAMMQFEKLLHTRIVNIEEKIARLAPGSEGLLVFPGISGERAPYWQENTGGGMIGLRRDHRPEHILRAIMESTAYRAYRLLNIMAQNGLDSESIRVVGGTAKNDVWNQIRADVWGRPVARPDISEATLLGTAMFCRSALEPALGLEEIARQWIRIAKRYDPDPKAHETYRKMSALFDELIESNADLFKALSDMVGSSRDSE